MSTWYNENKAPYRYDRRDDGATTWNSIFEIMMYDPLSKNSDEFVQII